MRITFTTVCKKAMAVVSFENDKVDISYCTERGNVMNKKRMFVIVTFLLIAAIIGVSGKVYVDKKEEKHESTLRVQKNLARFLVRNYEGVKKIEFRKFSKTKGLGYTSWSVTVYVNDDNIISFNIEDLSKVEDATVRHNPDTFHLKKSNKDLSKSLDDVEIIYLKGL